MVVVLPHKLKPCGMVWRGPWSHISQIYVLSSRSRDFSSVILAPKNAESSASRRLVRLRSGQNDNPSGPERVRIVLTAGAISSTAVRDSEAGGATESEGRRGRGV